MSDRELSPASTPEIVEDIGLRGSLEERFESTGNDATPAPTALDPETKHSDVYFREVNRVVDNNIRATSITPLVRVFVKSHYRPPHMYITQL